MAKSERIKTVLSTKGQVVLPKALRQQQGWEPGLELLVENHPEGLLLKRGEPLFKPTRLEDVIGMLKYSGPPITDAMIEQAITDEVRERWERFERTGSDYPEDDDRD